ncbi:MAG: hypothetical protein NHB14_18855 [Desulfosporosinus sp.]|nr:hypothetical protein [Desulfosporosinus sp.]
MGFADFSEILTWLKANNISKKAAVAAAHDLDALSSVVAAKREGILESILVGDGEKIRNF